MYLLLSVSRDISFTKNEALLIVYYIFSHLVVSQDVVCLIINQKQ